MAGWLDLILENHNYGIDVYRNPGNGTFSFSYVDPTSIGLPTSATDGDYGTALDFDDDGDIDIVARKQNQSDFFINSGSGTFSNGVDIDQALNGNKGGVSFADFDNDGDYDMVWTDNGVNQIWINNAGTLTATAGVGDGEPWASAGVAAPLSGIDGCAVGDVDNDGKVDLFLTNDTGTGYLFLNETVNGGSLSFRQDNLRINLAGNGEGASFADYDNDGDLDLYVVMKSDSNQLWRNSLNDENYLFVEPRIDLGSGLWRSAVGANVIIKDCEGNVISGIREVPTVAGHGTDAPDRVHFGLPNGPGSLYNVVVRYLSKNGSRIEIEKQITPSEVTDQVLIVYDTDDNAIGRCQDFDQDETFNRYDYDDDNDGIPDIAEIYRGDHDGDGILDYEDADFCSDELSGSGWNCSNGLPDPSGDMDADGTLNYADDDFYGCGGLVNGVCSAYDTDGDGLADHLDLDTDNDGIPDLIENTGIDMAGDGLVDGFATDTLIDTDKDGWYDLYDSFGSTYTSGTSLSIRDMDRDGIPDMFDLDSDNDGITDVIEAGGTDADGDGRADNFVDQDSDGFHDDYDPTDNDPETVNDAVFAASENTSLIQTGADADADGVVDDSEGYTGGDADGDSRLNHLDLDSDNDGITDLVESGGVDNDGDGVVDGANPDGSLTADVDNDGYDDGKDPDLNNDGDTSDGGDTGKPIVITSSDSDGDGRPESYPAFDNDEDAGTSVFSADRDGDNTLNAYDLDSDNDGIADLVESGGIDSDGNGMVDGLAGSGLFSGSNDADQDGYFDDYDPDSNLTDTDESESSDPLIVSVTDGSGSVDGHPAAADIAGNSALNGGTNADFDQDGIPNYLDLDSDRDGISDVIESFGSGADVNSDGRVDNLSSNDGNNNGWHNSYESQVVTTTDGSSDYSGNTLLDYATGEGKIDHDGDGLPNYLDIDADNDGIVDVIEAQASSTNMSDKMDGLAVGSGTDADWDGLEDENDRDQSGTYLDPVNTDGEDYPDYLDNDSDNDSFGDHMEGHDADMDGQVDNVANIADIDLDGLDDGFDTNLSSPDPTASNQSIQDTDGDMNSGGDRDWRDLDSSSLPVEWSDFQGEWEGAKVALTWKTSSELNSDYFDVERSYDGQLFEQIGQVDAAGTSTEQNSYGFLDRTPGKPLAGDGIFYRLRQVDQNGSFEFSSVVEMSIGDSQAGYLNAYPNPVSTTVNLEYNWNEERDAVLSLMTLTGQELHTQSLAYGSQAMSLDMSQYPSGSYVMVIRVGNTVLQKRIEKR